MSFSSLVDDINAMLDSAEPPSTDDCCIYKVPSVIRKLNEDAYTPKVVSIGPFHHGHPQLQNMERQKLIHFEAFLQQTDACLNTLVSYIESILSDFKGCYSETLPFSHNELLKLILIDSSFIIQLFWRSYDENEILFKPWLYAIIGFDLFLLENQLPFFVIEKIYSLSLSSTNASVPNTNIPSFLELIIGYFGDFNKSKLGFDNNDISIMHFTDLFRIFHLQHPIERRPSRDVLEEHMIHLPSATELLEAGDCDSVANLFNGLGKNVRHSTINSHFSILCKDLNAFCNNPWNKLKATLRRDYCKTPWQTAASIAGILLLVLTLIQTVCSILQVVQQPNAS